jgi:hypothetical protein
MRQNKKAIWLCDLTHTYQSIVMRQMPLGVGFIASFCQKELKEHVNIRVFKFVDQLLKELEKETEPLIIGFSNFLWNQNLNLNVSKRIKTRFPQAIIVFGGHNFHLEEEQRLSFFQKFPWIDFYIQRTNVIEKYRQGEYGSNVISKYRTITILQYTDLIINIATEELKAVIHKNNPNIPWIYSFIDEVKRFLTYKLTDVLNTSISFEDNFSFNITDFLDEKIPLEKAVESKQHLRFEHTSHQKELIEGNKILFGENMIGFSKMLSQVPLSKLLRVTQITSIP